MQGNEGKYITAHPLSDRYAKREFTVHPSLGKYAVVSSYCFSKSMVKVSV